MQETNRQGSRVVFRGWDGTQLLTASRKALSGFHNGGTDTFTVGGLGGVNNIAQTANTAINVFVWRKLCMQQQKLNKKCFILIFIHSTFFIWTQCGLPLHIP